MFIRELRRGVGRRLVARAGDVVPFEALRHGKDRKALMAELYDLMHALEIQRETPSALPAE